MNYKKTTLPNGLRIITVPMQGTNTATVLVMVGTGSKYEEKHENGISHFLEHMVFKGTKKRPKPSQIAVEIDSIGGQQNAFTGFEYTGYWTKIDARHIDLGLDIISDMSINGILDSAEIEKEKGTIIEEINMYEDMPAMQAEQRFYHLLYGDQPAGWDIAGPKENIKKFTRKDFIKYRKEHYTASNIVVAVAGNIDKDLDNKISGMFKGVSKAKPKNKVFTKEDKNRPKTDLYFKETNQTHFYLGGYAYKISSNKRAAASILFYILGRGMSSRLWKAIREKYGLSYYIRAEFDPATDTGVYAVRAGVDNKRTEKAIKLAVAELRKVRQKKVSLRELKKAKEMIKGRTSIALESSDDVASWIATQEILENKIITPEKYFAKIDAVTAEQVQEVANDLFTDDNLRLAMIGPHKDAKKFEKLLKI